MHMCVPISRGLEYILRTNGKDQGYSEGGTVVWHLISCMAMLINISLWDLFRDRTSLRTVFAGKDSLPLPFMLRQ